MQYAVFLAVVGLGLSVFSSASAQSLTGSSSHADIRVERVPIDLEALRAQGFDGEFVTMRDELENFPLNTSVGGAGVSAAPTSFTGPPGFEWPLNNLRGQTNTNFVRMVDLSLDPVGGPNGVVNATRAIEIVTHMAQPPGGFFLGAGLRFGGDAQGFEPLLPLAPVAGQNARVSAEYFISTIDQSFTFEPVSSLVGFITGRLYWGGECVEIFPGDCTDIGLPIGLVTNIYTLGFTCFGFSTCEFGPARYCVDVQGNVIAGCVPPAGLGVGDPVAPPIGNWSRFVAETTSDGRLRFLLDLLDGSGEVLIVDQPIFTSAFIDRVAINTSFESQDAFALIDNFEASGPIFGIPKPPPLECPYLDDMEWLNTDALNGQSTRWTAAISSQARVVEDGSRGRVIRQINNVSPDNRYRREMSTLLLPSSVTTSNDLVATIDVRSAGATVRGFALYNGTELAARVIFGRETNDESYQPRVYAQINPAYAAIDDAIGPDPFANAPVIGFDVADTGYDWPGDTAYRTLELRLSANGALRVSVDGQRIYAGVGAFTGSIDRFAFESENNALGEGAVIRIDELTLTCDAPSCAADFDLDDVVAFGDLNAVLSNFGATGLTGFSPGDADGDGAVGFGDLNAVLSAFGTSCD